MDSRRKTSQRLVLVSLAIVFALALNFSLEHIDSVLFGWLGLQYNPPSPTWNTLAFAMAVIPSLWMPIQLKRPSHFTYWVLYLMVIIPAMIIPYHVLARPPDQILSFTFALLSCFALLSLSYRLPRIVIPRATYNPAYFYGILAIVVLVFTVITWASVGFSLDFGLENIYDRRHAARGVFQQQSAISYIKGNLASALAPFAVAVGLARKQWHVFAVGVFGSLIVFSVEGSRSAAFLPIFIFALYPIIVKYRNIFGFAVIGGMLLLLLGSIISFYITKNPALPLVVSWRLFQVKGLLSSYYWDFFSTHEFMYYADGILKGVIPNPYPLATPRLIGLTYFNSPETNSNANIFAAAYGDFGYLGMLFITGITAVYFRLIDSLSHNRGFLISAFMAGFLGVKWSDVAFDTAILSHGTLVITILLLLVPKPNPDPCATSENILQENPA